VAAAKQGAVPQKDDGWDDFAGFEDEEEEEEEEEEVEAKGGSAKEEVPVVRQGGTGAPGVVSSGKTDGGGRTEAAKGGPDEVFEGWGVDGGFEAEEGVQEEVKEKGGVGGVGREGGTFKGIFDKVGESQAELLGAGVLAKGEGFTPVPSATVSGSSVTVPLSLTTLLLWHCHLTVPGLCKRGGNPQNGDSHASCALL